MGFDLNFQVGPQRLSDGDRKPGRIGNQGELVSNINGPHFEQALRGNLFMYQTVGQAILLSATTGAHATVWNPTGSGKLFVPVALRVSFLSGTTTIGSVLIAETLNAGSQIGTASPIPTATFAAVIGARRGVAATSAMLWSPAVNTFTAAPTVIAATGINMGAAAPTAGTGLYETKFDGALAFEPGTAMSVVYSVATSTALWFTTIWGLEIPYPLTS